MKKLKRIMSIMLLCVVAVGVYGCGAKSPSDAAKAYLEGLKTAEESELSGLFNGSTGEGKDEKISEETDKKLTKALQKISYTINSEKVDGDSATVNVKINGADLSKVLVDYMEKVFKMAFSEEFINGDVTEEESTKMFDDVLSECLDNTKYTDRTGDISFTKKDGNWVIVEDESLSKLLANIDQNFLDTQLPKIEDYAPEK